LKFAGSTTTAFIAMLGSPGVRFTQEAPPSSDLNTRPAPTCEMVTQKRCGLLGSTAMQLM
jgi:hypothetical protein